MLSVAMKIYYQLHIVVFTHIIQILTSFIFCEAARQSETIQGCCFETLRPERHSKLEIWGQLLTYHGAVITSIICNFH
jgi:hypothetical protein